MKYSILSLAATAVLALGAASASAQLLYSFETGDSPNGKDGFVPNGATVFQDTIGATQGSNSLKVVTSGGYTGTYTQSDLPAPLANPALTGFTMDITIPASPAYAGNYDDLGVILYVSDATTSDYGEQYGPATSLWANIDLAPGSTTTISVPLVGNPALNNATFTGNDLSFSQLLASGYYVSGFQLTMDGDQPQTFYVDNIQGIVPEPASITLIGAVGAMALGRRRKS
jgi:hypothetical protein